MIHSLVQWGRFLFHISHQTNVPGILVRGLHSQNEAKRQNLRYRSIADEGIQARRSVTEVPVGKKGTIHDYVPLFFGARPTMLFPVRAHVPQQEIFYLLVRWDVLGLPGTVFTDGHAATAGTNFFSDPKDLDKVDRGAVAATYWAESPVRRKKAAEVLVRDHVPSSFIDRIAVMDEEAKARAEQMVKARKLSIPVLVLPEYYYR